MSRNAAALHLFDSMALKWEQKLDKKSAAHHSNIEWLGLD